MAGMTPRAIELAHVVSVCCVERNASKWSVDVSACGTLAPNCFRRQEASSGRKSDALVMQYFRASEGFLDCGGIVGERGNRRSVSGLHVCDRALEGGDSRRVFGDSRLLGGSIGFGLLCRGLGIR